MAAAAPVAAASPLVAAPTVLAAEHAAPAAASSTERPFFLLEAQTSRLCLSFSLLLSLPGRFLALRRVVGAAVGLLLQQRLISSSPSRDSSCTRTHNPSAAQALYAARMRASGVVEGLPGVGWGCRTPFPATSAHDVIKPSSYNDVFINIILSIVFIKCPIVNKILAICLLNVS